VPELSEEDLAKYRESRKLQIESNPFYIKSSNVKKSESNNFVSGGSNPSINEIRSQSIDLKVPIIIPGVTSSDSYYRMTQIDMENKKLKKKMKNKLKNNDKKGKKSKNKNDVEEEDDDEDDMPVVKVLANEMPEGAVDDSGDDERSKRALNDPHRALDINLDEPLKADEFLPVPSHRATATNKSESSLKNSESSKKEEKQKSSSKKRKNEIKE